MQSYLEEEHPSKQSLLSKRFEEIDYKTLCLLKKKYLTVTKKNFEFSRRRPSKCCFFGFNTKINNLKNDKTLVFILDLNLRACNTNLQQLGCFQKVL